MPVAQNEHASGQPTCVETHSVAPLPAVRLGIHTVSTVLPSGNSSRSFTVPSPATRRVRMGLSELRAEAVVRANRLQASARMRGSAPCGAGS